MQHEDKTVAECIAHAEEVRRIVDADEERGLLDAVVHILQTASSRPPDGARITLETARATMLQYVQALLENDQFEAAATILWGADVYNWRPQASADVWRCLFEHDKVLIQGAGSMGKSFGAAAWFYLDWFRDPAHTSIKVISQTREHATRNIFANIKTFHRQALVRPGDGSDEVSASIAVTSDKKQGIHLVAIPKGEHGHGVLRGFHPMPRFGPSHHRWGRLTRTHVVVDEAEEVGAGVWEGINNILSSADWSNPGRIKIFGASNPKDQTSEFGRRCKPVAGWGSVDIEDDHEWDSGDGYKVLRVDAARCENVLHKKVVYHGLQTYDGFMSYMAKGKSAEALTMARGWFPDEGVAMGVITPGMVDNTVGVVRFIGPTIPCAAFDLALEGNDQVVCSHGRIGTSDGWTAQDGVFRPHLGGVRTMLQLDGQINFPKLPTLEQAGAIAKFCKNMKISPGWLAVDRTGNGAGIHDVLVSTFGSEVLGINYSWAASDTHILGEDSKKASEMYQGVVTELIFGLARYMEFEWIKIVPSFRNEALQQQATARRYKQKGKGLVRVESKQEYCKRTRSKSPDELDSLSILVYLVRQKAGIVPTMTAPKPESREKPYESVVDDSSIFVEF